LPLSDSSCLAPEPLQQAGCDRSLVEAAAGIAAVQMRVRGLTAASDREICNATRDSIF